VQGGRGCVQGPAQDNGLEMAGGEIGERQWAGERVSDLPLKY